MWDIIILCTEVQISLQYEALKLHVIETLLSNQLITVWVQKWPTLQQSLFHSLIGIKLSM